MKAYFAALIEPSLISENPKLAKKMKKEIKKNLKISNLRANYKVHNSFIFLGAKKVNKKFFDPQIIEKIETSLQTHLNKYYLNNKHSHQKTLKRKQELKETAQIVKNFLIEIDPHLSKVFNLQLKRVISDLPTQYYELQNKSMISLWHMEEENKIQFRLLGFEPQIFQIENINNEIDVEEIVDKLALLNFLWLFLLPTILHLEEMKKVLDRLALVLQGTHYKSNNPKIQSKLDMVFRILSAKLSALLDMDKVSLGILKLFQKPKAFLDKKEFKHSKNLGLVLSQISKQINLGTKLLIEVQQKLEKCQIHLKEYLDQTKDCVQIIQSKNEFKLVLLNTGELSSDLFVETELQKMWLDLFATDLPYFTYQKKIFTSQQQKMQASKENIISVRGLTKNYILGNTRVYALRGVDLEVKNGEFLAIVGNSGAGKTTLLNCMAGLDEPDYGVVLFKGKDLRKMKDTEKSRARLFDMGFIFQSYALLPHFNTRENVALPADLAGLSKKLKERIENLLNGVGIDKQAKQYPAELSGGQMQRVAIARALTNRPEVLFADEPTGDLDSVTGKQVMELIKKFHEETKTTIIIITHEQEIANYAQRQIILEDGIINN